jgi:hypothetical protein
MIRSASTRAVSMSASRRFPPPWTISKNRKPAFVHDHNGQQLA